MNKVYTINDLIEKLRIDIEPGRIILIDKLALWILIAITSLISVLLYFLVSYIVTSTNIFIIIVLLILIPLILIYFTSLFLIHLVKKVMKLDSAEYKINLLSDKIYNIYFYYSKALNKQIKPVDFVFKDSDNKNSIEIIFRYKNKNEILKLYKYNNGEEKNLFDSDINLNKVLELIYSSQNETANTIIKVLFY